LGVKWVRWDMDWSSIQSVNASSYDWSSTDKVANTANNYGIKSLVIITYTPRWARLLACRDDWQCAPADAKIFGTFAGQAALRYKGKISYFEIWNEPNLMHFGLPIEDSSKYTDILKEAYLGIKDANPEAYVISGGLSPAADDLDKGKIAPLTFLSSLYSLGGNAYFDAVGFHPYSFPASPSYIAPWNAWQQSLSIRQLMVNNGDAAKKIWLTEYGAPTGGSGKAFAANQINSFTYGVDYMSEEAQSDMMREVISFCLNNSNFSWLGPFFWYSLKDNGTNTTTIENFFGLIRYDGSKKPAYNTLKNLLNP
jgi:polysaccharide biosynthesis protein PslG